MRKLAIHSGVLKDLPGLSTKQRRQVVGAICDLLTEPEAHYSKKLKGSPYSRLAVGEYRVIYRAEDETIHVAVVGKRNDGEVYKMLDRMQ